MYYNSNITNIRTKNKCLRSIFNISNTLLNYDYLYLKLNILKFNDIIKVYVIPKIALLF